MTTTTYPQLTTLSNKILIHLHTCTSPSQLHQILTQIILHNLHLNTTITSHFITTSQSLNLLNTSLLLFHQTPRPHVFICNTLIRAFSHSHTPHTSLSIYTHMHRTHIAPNHYTFPFVLKPLADHKHLKQGQSVHTQTLKLGHFNDIYVQNSLLSLYSSCGEMSVCRKLFDEMPHRDVVSWTILIEGNRNVGKIDMALVTFERMMVEGVMPNHVTMLNALMACASSGALEMGVWIHEFVTRNGWELDVKLGTALIDMYGKCGRIDAGLSVFDSMTKKNVFTWNSIIRGLALAKSGDEAMQWFFRMEKEGIKADEASLTAVLCACSHSGLVEAGRNIFSSLMVGKYEFAPSIKHYGCMIDLLARAGCLQEAFEYMDKMPYEPNKPMLGALLASCRAHGNLELSEFVAKKLIELEPTNGAYYVLLSNLYAEMGRWNDVIELRSLMKGRGIEKDLGCSSFVEPEEQMNMFVDYNFSGGTKKE